MVSYLDADGYLERAYRTAMAYFEVPYNILMGKQWAFHGWTDWAYKQGNFHERYLLDIINALQQKGRLKDAAKLRREWEKKVTYMVYEDPWPFGSEMFVDRTAFESSYYVAEYAKLNPIKPEEQFWYDKNRKKWYSYTSFDISMIDRFMQNQLDGNLALRGLFEPGYANLGTAWSGQYVNLDYMTQMGGVALLDYAYRVYDADVPEYSAAIDYYDGYYVIQAYKAPAKVNPRVAKRHELDMLSATVEIAGVTGDKVILKSREVQKGDNQYEKAKELKNEFMTVNENNALFRVNLYDYLDTGLFLDGRLIRDLIRQEAERPLIWHGLYDYAWFCLWWLCSDLSRWKNPQG